MVDGWRLSSVMALALSVSRWLQMASAGGRAGAWHLCHGPLGVQQAHMHMHIDRRMVRK